MIRGGWRYSDGGRYRERFPEWMPVYGGGFQLLIVCETKINGRWEGFVSTPQVFWVDGAIVA